MWHDWFDVVFFTLCAFVIVYIIYRLFARSSGEYCKYSKETMGHTNGIHAFGYISAKSEPIWLKFGML